MHEKTERASQIIEIESLHSQIINFLTVEISWLAWE
jgi:hypothetical protein